LKKDRILDPKESEISEHLWQTSEYLWKGPQMRPMVRTPSLTSSEAP